jgi:hypothetical protein
MPTRTAEINKIRALAKKTWLISKETSSEFGPESFRWTVYMSRPGSIILNSQKVSRQVFPQLL